MPKIKIERCAKLNKEDSHAGGYNILSGATIDKKVWVNSMGDQ
jgi:hypothetical protein